MNLTPKPEKCVLVGVGLPSHQKWELEDHLEELGSLAQTAGAEIAGYVLQERDRYDSAFYIGHGKVEEIAARVEMEEISLIIFDDELTPAQVRNLENMTGVKVIDRPALILDIFAAHARTREARTQVELAQLNYMLPRLTRQWTHLSRQVGGIGTKGPGETQLETDRRLVRTRIAHLKNDLAKIEKQKKTQRKQQQDMFRVALIGYTNAGKSSIMNTLTNAGVLVEDKLFATLDTTTKRLELEHGMNVLLSDTVGFIRKLPHHLVASFKSTLAQAVESDLLLHVVDISHPHFEQNLEVVNQIAAELEFSDKEFLLIFNKVDLIKETAIISRLKKTYPDALFVSARQGVRIAKIRNAIFKIVSGHYSPRTIRLDLQKSHLVYRLSGFCKILDQKYTETDIELNILINKENEFRLNAILEGG